MKKILLLICLLCNLATQAKEIKDKQAYKSEVKTYLNKNGKHINKKQLHGGIWDAIVDFVDWLTSPLRPVWGEYKEDGMRSGNPWPKTLFPRSKSDDILDLVNAIRFKVVAEQSFENVMYSKIYENAQKPLTDLGIITNTTGVSTNFSIAKNAAFVYMIGKRPEKVNGTYDLTQSEREEFLNKALLGLQRENAFSSFVDGISIRYSTC